jgi:glutathione peroxidase
MSIYDFKLNSIDGDEVSMESFKGKVLVIVNTASKCGFAPQFSDLQKLYEKYHSQGLEILGFPCNQFADQEPGNNSEVKNICQINYGVDFTMFEKTQVRGINAHPLFKYLITEAPFKGFDDSSILGKMLYSLVSEKLPEALVGDSIKWNFTKFLVSRSGDIINRFEPTFEPMDMAHNIEKLLNVH